MSRIDELRTQKWFQELNEQVEQSSMTEVGRQIGYSRTTISLVLSGKYDGGLTAIAAKVLDTFTDHVTCPFLNDDITKGSCNDYQSRRMPTSHPRELDHWMACRDGCPHSTQSLGGRDDA
jgi:hypothetical protein